VIAGVVSYILLCLRGVAGLVSLTSPYSSEILFSAGDWSASGVLLCVRVRRLGAFGFMEVAFYCSSSVSWVSGCSCS